MSRHWESRAKGNDERQAVIPWQVGGQFVSQLVSNQLSIRVA